MRGSSFVVSKWLITSSTLSSTHCPGVSWGRIKFRQSIQQSLPIIISILMAAGGTAPWIDTGQDNIIESIIIRKYERRRNYY